MKLVQIIFHFEYSAAIEALLDRQGIEHYVRYSMIEGKDHEGKHFGSQVFPGSATVMQVQVAEEQLDALLGELDRFRKSRPAHEHLQALVLPIERTLW